MKRVILHMIASRKAREYEVEVEYAGHKRSFVFVVCEVEGLEILQYEDDFAEFFHGNTAPLKPIYKAVSAFHDACKTELLVP